MIFSFAIEGSPVAKGRPRLTVRGGHARAYTPAKTRSYESMVAERAREAFGDASPFAGPVEIEAHFSIGIAKSWKASVRRAALDGTKYPGKPDIDNYLKALADGLNGIVYADDSQIVSARVTKRYAVDPGVVVTVRSL